MEFLPVRSATVLRSSVKADQEDGHIRRPWRQMRVRGHLGFLLYPTGMVQRWVRLAYALPRVPPAEWISWVLRPPARKVSLPMLPWGYLSWDEAIQAPFTVGYPWTAGAFLDGYADHPRAPLRFRLVLDEVLPEDVGALARLVVVACLAEHPARFLWEVGEAKLWARMLGVPMPSKS